MYVAIYVSMLEYINSMQMVASFSIFVDDYSFASQTLSKFV